MDGEKFTEDVLFRQVKSAIAGHNFKQARKIIEQHLDDSHTNPRIWEMYGNVLKKLNKVDKAKAAFLRRDELKRDDLAFKRLADDYIDDADLDYLSSHEQSYTHEQYVYGMEDADHDDAAITPPETSGRFGSVLSLGQRPSSSNSNSPEQQSPALEIEEPSNSALEEFVHTDILSDEDNNQIAVDVSENVVQLDEALSNIASSHEEMVGELLPVLEEAPPAKVDDDFWSTTSEILASASIESDLFDTDVYAFDPDELDSPETSNDDVISITERLTIEQRAVQLAAAFIARHDWPRNCLDLLTHIFSVKAYGLVVKFLNHYAEAGMRPEELRLAKHLRESWQQLPKYWITFYRNGDSAASYYNFSWSQSLRFVMLVSHCQNGMLDEDILQENLETMYYRWFNSSSLRRSYRSFSKYINAAMDQIEEDGVLFEYEAGFGSLREARDLHFSDIGETDMFHKQLLSDLECYGYSLDRSEYRPMRICEDIMYDAAHYNQHRILLADHNNKEENNE